jgi:hypothetical protein
LVPFRWNRWTAKAASGYMWIYVDLPWFMWFTLDVSLGILRNLGPGCPGPWIPHIFVRIGRTCSDHPFQLAQLDREINVLNKGLQLHVPIWAKKTHDTLFSKEHSLQVAAALDKLPNLPTANSERFAESVLWIPCTKCVA